MSSHSFYHKQNPQPSGIRLTEHDMVIVHEIGRKISDSGDVVLETTWNSMHLIDNHNKVLLRSHWRDYVDVMIKTAHDSGKGEIARLVGELEKNFQSASESLDSANRQAIQLESRMTALDIRLRQSIEAGIKITPR